MRFCCNYHILAFILALWAFSKQYSKIFRHVRIWVPASCFSEVNEACSIPDTIDIQRDLDCKVPLFFFKTALGFLSPRNAEENIALLFAYVNDSVDKVNSYANVTRRRQGVLPFLPTLVWLAGISKFQRYIQLLGRSSAIEAKKQPWKRKKQMLVLWQCINLQRE